MSKTPDRSERRKQRLEIVYRAIDEMTPDPANARQHSKKQILKPPSALTARCTTSVWIGAISRSCWPPAEKPMAS